MMISFCLADVLRVTSAKQRIYQAIAAHRWPACDDLLVLADAAVNIAGLLKK
jgi:hypothetical protein